MSWKWRLMPLLPSWEAVKVTRVKLLILTVKNTVRGLTHKLCVSERWNINRVGRAGRHSVAVVMCKLKLSNQRLTLAAVWRHNQLKQKLFYSTSNSRWFTANITLDVPALTDCLGCNFISICSRSRICSKVKEAKRSWREVCLCTTNTGVWWKRASWLLSLLNYTM